MFELRLENESGSVVDINDGVRYIVIPPVSGLTPPSASIFTSKSPNRKGAKYNGSTLAERNIVITVKILGDVEANRNALYAWVDTEQYTKIYYQNGTKNVYCEGYVQDCDIDLFTDNEVVSLAILCPEPYWRDMQEVVVDISSLLKQFTFPFAINHTRTVEYSSPNPNGTTAITTMNEGVPLSTIKEDATTTVFNAGAETGFQIAVRCKAVLRNFEMFDTSDTSRRFKINRSIPAGAMLVIDTDGSPKTCKVTNPDGTTENYMKYVGINPTWFTLKKGVNTFGYRADSGAAEAEVFVSFTNKFLGV